MDFVESIDFLNNNWDYFYNTDGINDVLSDRSTDFKKKLKNLKTEYSNNLKKEKNQFLTNLQNQGLDEILKDINSDLDLAKNCSTTINEALSSINSRSLQLLGSDPNEGNFIFEKDIVLFFCKILPAFDQRRFSADLFEETYDFFQRHPNLKEDSDKFKEYTSKKFIPDLKEKIVNAAVIDSQDNSTIQQLQNSFEKYSKLCPNPKKEFEDLLEQIIIRSANNKVSTIITENNLKNFHLINENNEILQDYKSIIQSQYKPKNYSINQLEKNDSKSFLFKIVKNKNSIDIQTLDFVYSLPQILGSLVERVSQIFERKFSSDFILGRFIIVFQSILRKKLNFESSNHQIQVKIMEFYCFMHFMLIFHCNNIQTGNDVNSTRSLPIIANLIEFVKDKANEIYNQFLQKPFLYFSKKGLLYEFKELIKEIENSKNRNKNIEKIFYEKLNTITPLLILYKNLYDDIIKDRENSKTLWASPIQTQFIDMKLFQIQQDIFLPINETQCFKNFQIGYFFVIFTHLNFYFGEMQSISNFISSSTNKYLEQNIQIFIKNLPTQENNKKFEFLFCPSPSIGASDKLSFKIEEKEIYQAFTNYYEFCSQFLQMADNEISKITQTIKLVYPSNEIKKFFCSCFCEKLKHVKDNIPAMQFPYVENAENDVMQKINNLIK